MSIRSELIKFIKENNNNNLTNLDRDIQVVLHYFGFGDEVWPTLESTAEKFEIGTRERVRQIIKVKFKDKAPENESWSYLKRAYEYFCVNRHINFDKAIHDLQQSQIIEKGLSLRGLLNIFEYLGYEAKFEIFNASFSPVGKKEYEEGSNLYVIDHSLINEILPIFKNVKKWPGQVGLADLNHCLRSHDLYNEDVFLILKEHLLAIEEVVTITQEDSFFYIFENRDNYLINSLEKIFSLGDSFEQSIVINGILQSFKIRSQKKIGYPDINIVNMYLHKSEIIIRFGEEKRYIGFSGQPSALSEDESQFFEFIKSNSPAGYPLIREHFTKEKGFSEAWVSKLLKKPFIIEDKSAGRTKYRYYVIKPVENISPNVGNSIFEFAKNRLDNLRGKGTDRNQEIMARKEQQILRDYLFGGKTEETCGICSCLVKVDGLRAAHKKPRSICSEEERLDPDIVMPMCLFGCDYLYEYGYISVKNGQVTKGTNISDEGLYDSHRNKILGLAIEDRWQKKESYFF